MPSPRMFPGTSDPITYTCTCPASYPDSEGGLVLLFYRYFALSPVLPAPYLPLTSSSLTDLLVFNTSVTKELGLKGKIRVAREGFNVTVGGTKDDVMKYIERCSRHWTFTALGLGDGDSSDDMLRRKRKEFFKMGQGCGCLFGEGPSSEGARVKVCEEITPMGWWGFTISDNVGDELEKNGVIHYVEPEAWHCLISEGRGGKQDKAKPLLIDLRNHYESRIGYFVDPSTGEPALRPAIRRFSQWPLYVRNRLKSEVQRSGVREGNEKSIQILTYCTGGIRCEKGARWLAENMDRRDRDTVMTLKGGIAAYLMWIEEEIKAGRKEPGDSLFKGKNYVFDARGAVGLKTGGDPGKPVSTCHLCGNFNDRLIKCSSRMCHLVLVVCKGCEGEKARCCDECREMDLQEEASVLYKSRNICNCEREREARLWGRVKHGLG